MSKKNQLKRTLILGLGNVLLQDEGLGVHALREMQKMEWPENIELLDGGTGGFVLLSLFNEYEQFIIIDATLSNDPPGTIKVIEPKFAKDFPRSLSTHELGLKDLIESAQLLGKMPKIFLIVVNINPKQEMNIELTDNTRKTIPRIIETVQNVVQQINS
ncbi:MAG TPA: hydrogenase maturation protease [Bacteroidales bacterium]